MWQGDLVTLQAVRVIDEPATWHAGDTSSSWEVHDRMSFAPLDHPGPWSEDDYLAIDAAGHRIELFDGSLLVSPAPKNRHQRLSSFLWAVLDERATDKGLLTWEAVNMRLATGRIFIPDVIVADVDGGDGMIEAADVVLAVEIASPSTAGIDRSVKMPLYAAAGIAWCLMVEQEPTGAITMQMYRLEGDQYVQAAEVGPGETLTLTEPFDVTLDPDALQRRVMGRRG